MRSTPWHDFRIQASRKPARIVLADGEDPRAIQAAAQALETGVATPLLIGSRTRMESQWKLFSKASVPCLDLNELTSADRERYAIELRTLRKFKSLSPEEADAQLKDPLILGCLVVKTGQADGFVGGATRTTADTLKAVFSIIGLAPETHTLFGFFFIEKKGDPNDNSLLLLADCAVSPDPSPKQLANIAIGAANAFDYFTGKPGKVALLSFSTYGSAEHVMVQKIREAVSLAKAKAPDLLLEGEWQTDAALDSLTAERKGVGNSPMAGKANVLIFPDLNSGNIAYKLAQRVSQCRAVGPILWGTAQPANDLSRGCSTEDILDMLALTTLQTQKTILLEKSSNVH